MGLQGFTSIIWFLRSENPLMRQTSTPWKQDMSMPLLDQNHKPGSEQLFAGIATRM